MPYENDIDIIQIFMSSEISCRLLPHIFHLRPHFSQHFSLSARVTSDLMIFLEGKNNIISHTHHADAYRHMVPFHGSVEKIHISLT